MSTHVLNPDDAHVLVNIGRSVAAIAAFALLLVFVSLTIG